MALKNPLQAPAAVPFRAQARPRASEPIAEPLSNPASLKITLEEPSQESLLDLASAYDKKLEGVLDFRIAKAQLLVHSIRIEGMPYLPSMIKAEIIDAVLKEGANAGGLSLAELVIVKARAVLARWSALIPKGSDPTPSEPAQEEKTKPVSPLIEAPQKPSPEKRTPGEGVNDPRDQYAFFY